MNPLMQARHRAWKLHFSGRPELKEVLESLFVNLDRVRWLLTVYEWLRKYRKGPARGRTFGHLADMLRAATVLCHATLEDGLRSLLLLLLPRTKECLDGIALAGFSEYGRAEKFSLGELSRFKGKTAEEIVELSVIEHLGRQSFNDATDICRALERMDIDPACCKKRLKYVEEMMKRRHHIVHNADRDRKKGRGHHFALSISAREVRCWNKQVGLLFRDVLFAIADSGRAKTSGS
jgi:hypothetical protein